MTDLSFVEWYRLTLSGDRTVRLFFSGPCPTQESITELIDYLRVGINTFPVNTPGKEPIIDGQLQFAAKKEPTP